MYREHFVERQYLQHGVELRPGDTVIDVGAHIGMFTLCAAEVRALAPVTLSPPAGPPPSVRRPLGRPSPTPPRRQWAAAAG